MRLFDSSWQESPVHHLFLLTFLYPRKVDDVPDIPPQLPYESWEDALGEDVFRATTRFQALGVIAFSNLHTHLNVSFTKDQLKKMLKQRDLPVSGKKDDLISRLIQLDKEDIQMNVVDLTLLECTNWGKTIIEQYWQKPQIKDRNLLEKRGESKPSSKTIREAAKWILAAIVTGVIGNRADDAFVAVIKPLIQKIKESLITQPTTTPMPTETPKPTDTPQPTRTKKPNINTSKRGLITSIPGYDSKEKLKGKSPKYNYLDHGIEIKNPTNQVATVVLQLLEAANDKVVQSVSGSLAPGERKTFRFNSDNIPTGIAVYAVISSDVEIEKDEGFLSFLGL